MKKINKKGQVTYYILFLIVVTFIIFITGVFAPIGARIATVSYGAGEQLLAGTQPDIDNIQNTTVRAEVQAAFTSAMAAQQNNIEVNTALYKYGWIFVIVIIALGLFLLTRVNVEYGRGVF